jgi:hypothetical protein
MQRLWVAAVVMPWWTMMAMMVEDDNTFFVSQTNYTPECRREI